MKRRLPRLWNCLGWLLPFVLAAACSSEPLPPPQVTATPPPTRLLVGLATGASSIADLISEPYAREQDKATLQFIEADNETLLNDLEDGFLDAILVYQVPDGSPHWFNPVALDGLILIGHPDNAIEGLSRFEAQSLFSGRVDNWSALGGPDLPVTVITREPGSGTRAIFVERIMEGAPTSVTAQVESSNEYMVETVASIPGAIGYSMMAASSSVEGITAIAIDGHAPTPANTAHQSYPYAVPLYFVSRQEPTGQMRALLAWLQSPEGQDLIGEKYGRIR